MAGEEFTRKQIEAREVYEQLTDESVAQCQQDMARGMHPHPAINKHRVRMYHAQQAYRLAVAA